MAKKTVLDKIKDSLKQIVVSNQFSVISFFCQSFGTIKSYFVDENYCMFLFQPKAGPPSVVAYGFMYYLAMTDFAGGNIILITDHRSPITVERSLCRHMNINVNLVDTASKNFKVSMINHLKNVLNVKVRSKGF